MRYLLTDEHGNMVVYVCVMWLVSAVKLNIIGGMREKIEYQKRGANLLRPAPSLCLRHERIVNPFCEGDDLSIEREKTEAKELRVRKGPPERGENNA